MTDRNCLCGASHFDLCVCRGASPGPLPNYRATDTQVAPSPPPLDARAEVEAFELERNIRLDERNVAQSLLVARLDFMVEAEPKRWATEHWSAIPEARDRIEQVQRERDDWREKFAQVSCEKMGMQTGEYVGLRARLRRSARLTKAADEMREQMKLARKFIASRWLRMHPEGIELYDDCCANYDALRAQQRDDQT